MLARHSQSDPTHNQQEALITLQHSLLETWQQHCTPEYYQHTVLAHLDTLTPSQAALAISHEIKLTHQGQSLCTLLVQHNKERQSTLQVLRSEREKSVEEGCELVGRLRESNLGVAETVIQIYRQFGGKGQAVEPYFRELCLSLQQEMSFLREGYLNAYINFKQGYDPFLLHHSETRHRTQGKPHPAVHRLFALPISAACKLIKAHSQLMGMLGSGSFSAHPTPDPPFTRMTNPFLPSVRREVTQNNESSDFRKKTSVNFRKHTLSLEQARQNESRQNQPRQKLSLGKPLVQAERFKLLVNEREVDGRKDWGRGVREEEGEDVEEVMLVRRKGRQEEEYKLVPINFRASRRGNFRITEDTPRNNSRKLIEPASERSNRSFQPKLQPIQNSLKNMQPRQPSPEPYSRTIERDSQLTTKPPKSHPPPQKTLEVTSAREIKMRAGKFTLPELLKYLRGLPIGEQGARTTLANPKWEQSFRKCQSYVCEMLVNGELSAVVVTMVLPEADYLIKLWAPLENCSRELSAFLFGKYVDYLERATSTREIYYNGDEGEETKLAGMVPKREKVLFRKRVAPVVKRKREFQPFLSVRCSNLVVRQEVNSANLLYSDEIEPFNENNTYLASSIASVSRNSLPPTLLMLAKINEQITDLKTLNSLLTDEEFDTYEGAASVKMGGITAMRVGVDSPFKCSFLLGEGFFKLTGEEIYRQREALIVRLVCVRSNLTAVFGKGFAMMSQFVGSLRGSTSKKACEFSVKMFSKQLYGRLPGGGSSCVYGNWEITLWWQDELQGRLRHALTECETFGREAFFVGLQFDQQLCYAFQVHAQDFLF